MAGDIRTRIVIDADARQAISALDAVDKAADDADRSIDGITDTVRVDVTADTSQVDAAAADVDRLRNLARDPVRIPVDITDADLDRVNRTRDGIRDVGVNAEGLQRGIGPLRGFTDELGGTAGAAGVATNALIDAGEAVEIFGAQLGLSQQTLGRVSLALGGIGVAVGAATYAWSKYREAQEKAKQRAEELIDVQRQLSDGKYREAAEKLADTYGDLFADLAAQGVDAAAAVAFLKGETDGTTDAMRALDDETTVALITLRAGFEAAGTDLANATSTTDALERALAGTGDTAADTADDVRDITSAFDDMTAKIAKDRSALDLADTFDQVRTAATDAWTAGVEGATDAESKARDYERSLLDAQQAAIDVATEVGGIPESKLVEINALIAAGDIDEAERQLSELTETRDVIVRVVTDVAKGLPNYFGGTRPDRSATPGTIVNQTINVDATPSMRSVDAATTRWRRVNGT